MEYSLKRSESESHSVMSDSLRPLGLYSPWNSSGQTTGVGSLSLLQRMFPTQGLNPSLPHYRWILYQLSHQRRPIILEWVVYPFSSGSSWPRNWTSVSCIADRFFTNRAKKEAPFHNESIEIPQVLETAHFAPQETVASHTLDDPKTASMERGPDQGKLQNRVRL